jgi:hypothetical protein
MSKFNVGKTVAEALQDAGGDDAKAIKFLIERAEHDSALNEKLLWEGANQVLRNHYANGRQRARSDAYNDQPLPSGGPKVQPAGDSASDYDPSDSATRERRDNAAAEFWSQYTLYGHMRLRDASVRDLRVSVGQHKTQAAGHMRAATFESRLADLMVKGGVKSNDMKVGQFFDLKHVVKISKELL